MANLTRDLKIPPADQPDDEFSKLGGSANDPLSNALRNAFRKVFGRIDAEASAAGLDPYDQLGNGAQDPLTVAVRESMRKVLGPVEQAGNAPAQVASNVSRGLAAAEGMVGHPRYRRAISQDREERTTGWSPELSAQGTWVRRCRTLLRRTAKGRFSVSFQVSFLV
ncbi:MAG: hypothetical protein U1E56_02295 [Bauldia sp.]|mgnify:CR=1 FL=1